MSLAAQAFEVRVWGAQAADGTMVRLAGIPLTVVFILVVELCERFCFYTIQGSQKFFLSQNLGYDNAQSTSITTVFNTACYLTCLGGGVLGDRFIGRYATIACLASLYVAGAFVLAISTNPRVNDPTLFFVGSFLGIAVGTGGIKPIVCNFGADQIVGEGMDKAKERFFSYFYWTINIGAGVGLALMTTVATAPENFGIAQDYGYFVSYLTAAIAMATCLSIFLLGTCLYINKFRRSTVKLFRPLANTFIASARRSFRGAVCLLGWLLLLPFFILSFFQAFAESGSDTATFMAYAAFGVAAVQLSCLIWAHADNSFLVAVDDAQGDAVDETVGQGSATAEEIRLTFQTLPMLLIANTIFNFAYTMMIGPFLSQSCQMDLRLGGGQISGAFFNVADSFAIIALIPIFDGLAYPFIENWRGRPVSTSEKLVGGFASAALSMASAICLEYRRRASGVVAPSGWSPDAPSAVRFPNMPFDGSGSRGWNHYESLMGQCVVNGINYCSNCAPKIDYPFCDGSGCPSALHHAGIYMSKLSGFWMFIPFALIGLGEIMVMPVLYHYAYVMTPRKTQSVIQAVNLVFQGAYPPALVGVFSTVLSSSQPNDLNRGHIEVFYYISLVIIFLGTPVFFVVARRCQVVRPQDEGSSGLGSALRVVGSSSVLAGVVAGSYHEPPEPRNSLLNS